MTHQPTGESTVCLLCASPRLKGIDRLTGEQLRKLWRDGSNINFSPEAFDQIKEKTIVQLYQCHDCGFKFFDPKFGGGASFYRELEHPDYYISARPEFTRTRDFAVRHRLTKVLDVGCGSGAFLNLVRASGLETFGLELNVVAAEKARAQNHRIHNCLLHQLPKEESDYNLVTLFQVLEHVPDPLQVMRDAADRLSSGGYIAVAVPSEEGVLRLAPLDPHQWPPHHTSRWRRADFAQIARRCGLQIVEQGGDTLFGGDIEAHWKRNNRMATVLGRRPTIGGDVLPKALSFLYRALHLKHLLSSRGSSIYAFFLKA